MDKVNDSRLPRDAMNGNNEKDEIEEEYQRRKEIISFDLNEKYERFIIEPTLHNEYEKFLHRYIESYTNSGEHLI